MSLDHPCGEHASESLFGRIADEFSDRINGGESPTIQEYIERYPDVADLLREGLPIVAALKDAGHIDRKPVR